MRIDVEIIVSYLYELSLNLICSKKSFNSSTSTICIFYVRRVFSVSDLAEIGSGSDNNP